MRFVIGGQHLLFLWWKVCVCFFVAVGRSGLTAISEGVPILWHDQNQKLASLAGNTISSQT